MLNSKIIDSRGTKSGAKVTKRGQLVTSPLGFSKFYPTQLITNDAAVTSIPPKSDSQFIITDMILYANKNVGTTDASVCVFESDGANSDNQVTVIFEVEIPKQTNITLTGLNIIVSEGVWVNAVTDDNIVFVNIGGYYVDAE